MMVSDIAFTALMKAWDFRVRSIKLYRLVKPGVDSNKTMNQTASWLLPSTGGTDILPARGVYHEVSVTMIPKFWCPREASHGKGKEVIEIVAELLVLFAAA